MNEQLVSKTTKYIVGVSGGVDSMALLDQLVTKQYQVVVCHVNYHFRHDSNIDQELVEQYCNNHQIPCFVYEQNKHHSKGNFQAQAREIRYTFYKEIADKMGCTSVLLGHHKDDVIETILMQQQRGNIRGYVGIKDISTVKGLQVIRPMLDYTKKQLYEYCHLRNVNYHEDYTNFQTEFTRDYHRNITLKEYTDQQKDDLLQQALNINKQNQTLYKQCLPYLTTYKKLGYLDKTTIPLEVRKTLLYELLKEVMDPRSISESFLLEIEKQIDSKQPNIKINLNVNAQFIKEYDTIYIIENKQKESYCLNYDEIVYSKEEHFSIQQTGHINEGIHVKQSDFPITIRTWKPGDKIKTSGGTKKVARLFIDNKIPVSNRVLWPIILNCYGEILLIPNIAKNIDYLCTKPNLYVVK